MAQCPKEEKKKVTQNTSLSLLPRIFSSYLLFLEVVETVIVQNEPSSLPALHSTTLHIIVSQLYVIMSVESLVPVW